MVNPPLSFLVNKSFPKVADASISLAKLFSVNFEQFSAPHLRKTATKLDLHLFVS